MSTWQQKMKWFLAALFALTLLVAAASCGQESPTIPSGGTTINYAPESDFDWVESGGNATITNYTGAGGVVNIPQSLDDHRVTVIGESAFEDCASLTSVRIPYAVKTIGRKAFDECTSLTNITFGNSETAIGEQAFYGCTSLTNVTIPDSVTTIGRAAFHTCTSLTNVTIPDAVTTIGNYAFNRCLSLTSVTIPDAVTTIGRSAFRNCASLMSVTIPDAVETIGAHAFRTCSLLTSVTVEATTPPTLNDDNAFIGNGAGRKIYVPAASVAAYQGATNWSTYAADIEGY